MENAFQVLSAQEGRWCGVERRQVCPMWQLEAAAEGSVRIGMVERCGRKQDSLPGFLLSFLGACRQVCVRRCVGRGKHNREGTVWHAMHKLPPRRRCPGGAAWHSPLSSPINPPGRRP